MMAKQFHLQHAVDILVKEINQHEADGLLINSEQNRWWLLNFAASAGYVLVTKSGQVTFLVDQRYFHAAKAQLGQHLSVQIFHSTQDLVNLFRQANIQCLLIEDMYTNVKSFQWLSTHVPHLKLFSAQGVRAIKFAEELVALQKAADIAVNTTEFIKTYATPNKSEKAVALAATIKMLELGGTKNSFAPIVAGGINGANPHHHPTDYLLKAHELVTLDLGCEYDHYCSDMTRTWAVANSELPKELQNLHDAVLVAQNQGLAIAHAQNTTCMVDAACRDYLKTVNLDQYFVHSTGHGLGIDVHELPNVTANANFNTTLENGMVITIEPGVYVPEVGGVRIEDSVIIQNNQPIVLNAKASKKSHW